MALFSWLQRLSRGIATQNKSGRTRSRRSRSPVYRPWLEALEVRLAPATNITILASGVGTLDHFLSATKGTITTADDPGDTVATLSKTALQGVGAGVPISIAADNAIIFQNLGTLNLKTGHGVSATFSTTTGAISFNQTTNTVLTMGGALILTAGTDLTVSNLNTSGGNVLLTAGANAAGNLQFGRVVAGATGHVALQATNAGGGSIVQSGATSTATGLAINATATGNIVVNSLAGPAITLTSNTGSVSSAGSQAVRAGSQLTVNAATGITLNTVATWLSASNSTSGNIFITQTAAALRALKIDGSGVVNEASGGSITVTNGGAGISVGGAGVLSNNGTVTLAAVDLHITAPVNSHTARTILTSSHPGGHIDVGTNTLGTVGLTQAELNEVTAAVLQIGSATAGTINVSATISSAIGWSTLTLVNNGAITEAPTGALHVPNLRISSAGPIALVGINHVGVVAADAAKAFFLDNRTNPLSIGVVDGDVGILTNGSAIHLVADDLDIMQPVTTGSSSAGIVTLEPFTRNRSIDLGTNTSGKLGLTVTELNKITAGVLRIGSSRLTGNITVTGAISDLAAGWSTLSLISGGSISESSGSLVVTNLAVQGGGSVVLGSFSNAVTHLAGKTAAAQFSFTNSSDLTIAAVDGVGNIRAGLGKVTLIVIGSLLSGSAVTQNDVVAASLTAVGTSGIGNVGQALKVAVAHLSAGSANSNIYLAEAGTAKLTGAGLSAGTAAITLTKGTFVVTASDQIAAASTLDIIGATLNLGSFANTVAALNLTSTSTLAGRINSFAPGHFGGLTITGDISLGNAHLSLSLGAGFILPPVGTTIVLLGNVSSTPVFGRFVNAPQNTIFLVGGHRFLLSYTDANFDVTLTSLD